MPAAKRHIAHGNDFIVHARSVLEDALGEKWQGSKSDWVQAKRESDRAGTALQQQRIALANTLERNNIRGIVRLSGMPRNEVKTLIHSVGEACWRYERIAFADFPAPQFSVRRIRTFVEKDKKRLTPKQGLDEAWTYIAIDPKTRAIPWWTVGPGELAPDQCSFESDGQALSQPWPTATTRWIAGLHDGLARKVVSHISAIAVLIFFHNFGRVRRESNASPAMAAGCSDHVWRVDHMLSLCPRGEGTPLRGERNQ
jgi:hypothetical protein